MKKRISLLAIVLILSACRDTKSMEPSIEKPAPPVPETSRIRIPSGMFLFGATEEEVEIYLSGLVVNFPGLREKLRKDFVTPPVPMEISDFQMDEFEVTNHQYAVFLDSTEYSPESGENFLKHWDPGLKPPDWALDFPVVWVSQADAQAYCEWAGGSLPTEQEWERAAKGADGRIFPWGNEAPQPHTTNLKGRLEPVGNRPEDVSPFSIYDLGGNVSELTATTIDRNGSEYVVVKGGNFLSGYKEALTFSRQIRNTVTDRSETIGFRCVVR